MKQYHVNTILIGEKSNSHTPFILTFEISNKKVPNCLVDLGFSSNVMPYVVCQNLNVEYKKYTTLII